MRSADYGWCSNTFSSLEKRVDDVIHKARVYVAYFGGRLNFAVVRVEDFSTLLLDDLNHFLRPNLANWWASLQPSNETRTRASQHHVSFSVRRG